jgi:hypothetical protein
MKINIVDGFDVALILGVNFKVVAHSIEPKPEIQKASKVVRETIINLFLSQIKLKKFNDTIRNTTLVIFGITCIINF